MVSHKHCVSCAVSNRCTFQLKGDLYATLETHDSVECLCIPRTLCKGKCSLPEVTIDQTHNTLGHLGSQKTLEYTCQWFWWPRMGCDIEKFCLSCETCQMSKSSNQLKPGLLHSLPIPSHPWESIGMDFVGPFSV